jgi:hypothetical protein
MSGPKFRTKKGELTAYAFACGYLQTDSYKENELTMGYETPCYYIKVWIGFEGRYQNWNIVQNVNEYKLWLTFDYTTKLKDIRRIFKQLQKAIRESDNRDRLLKIRDIVEQWEQVNFSDCQL